ncbi:hypothetical protein PMO31116_00795 [Pandoraea morbifera]|uniref:Uncharacterized protein n=1 Tax=Pandoraea morbifera TaxID=2508300 RepID=A0A5E4SJU9_9BURK|nr:hypothetical protein [Pandoraea morbifera]VVD75062.1 hypothetical protein PMO31116_00795 [Pandoraea morbifera]
MNIIHRSGLRADPVGSLQDRSPSRRGEGATSRFQRRCDGSNGGQGNEREARAFSLAGESIACVSGPAEVLRWLRAWHARQEVNWDGASALRVVVHGGVLDTLVVEARRGRLGITVSLLCVQLTMFRRLLARRGHFSRALTARMKLPVTVEVEARYVP